MSNTGIAGFKSLESLISEIKEYAGKRLLANESMLFIVPQVWVMASAWFWMAFGIIGAFRSKMYSLILTNQRLLMVKIGWINNLKSITAFPISDVRVIKYTRGMLYNKVKMSLNGKKYLFKVYKNKAFSENLENVVNHLPEQN